MTESYDRVEALQASPLFNDLMPLENSIWLTLRFIVSSARVMFCSKPVMWAMPCMLSCVVGYQLSWVMARWRP